MTADRREEGSEEDLEYRIIGYFYPREDNLKEVLLRHSMCVRDKALAILDALDEDSPVKAACDPCKVRIGAMLHDIGICDCSAPSIYCMGEKPYLCHGLAGAQMLRTYGKENGIDLECFARICERHTGAGLTAQEISENALPLPERDFLPENVEEKLICLADKFFSKSGSMKEKSLKKVRSSMAKFGPAVLERFEALCTLFDIKDTGE